MRHYATLFDRGYLCKGLLLYESLKRHSSEPFKLYVLAMDAETEAVLRELNIKEIEIVPLHVLEEQLGIEDIRNTRTWAEFCWSMASVFTNDLLNGPSNLPAVTYLDSDLYFFSDPEQIFKEIGLSSIAVIPHRLIPSKQYLEATSGKFNVSWVTFQASFHARACLRNWAALCIGRCSAEAGGDQKYLDKWPERYHANLHVIENIGAGLAPWNLANYKLTEGPCVDGRPVVFFHYHELQYGVRLTNYDLRPEDIKFIYEPYLAAYEETKAMIEGVLA